MSEGIYDEIAVLFREGFDGEAERSVRIPKLKRLRELLQDAGESLTVELRYSGSDELPLEIDPIAEEIEKLELKDGLGCSIWTMPETTRRSSTRRAPR